MGPARPCGAISAAFAAGASLDRRSVMNIINSKGLHVGVVTGAANFDRRRSEIPCAEGK